MIKVTNQEEFKKCLLMLESDDVECRLLGWELLCGCTDLHSDALLAWSYTRGVQIRNALIYGKDFRFTYGFSSLICMSYAFIIKEFTIKSKIPLFHNEYLKLKYK